MAGILDLRTAEERIDYMRQRGKRNELQLTGMQLEKLPASVGMLGGLKELALGHNRLRAVPAEVFALTSLVTLDLTGNALSSLPPSIGNLTRLQTLHLSNNLLEELPSDLVKLQSLQWLDLRANKLHTLPTAELMQMPELALLWLDDNPCCSPTAGLLTSAKFADWAQSRLLGAGCAKLGCVQRSEGIRAR